MRRNNNLRDTQQRHGRRFLQQLSGAADSIIRCSAFCVLIDTQLCCTSVRTYTRKLMQRIEVPDEGGICPAAPDDDRSERCSQRSIYTDSAVSLLQRMARSSAITVAMAPSIFSVDFSLSILIFPAGSVRMKMLCIASGFKRQLTIVNDYFLNHER